MHYGNLQFPLLRLFFSVTTRQRITLYFRKSGFELNLVGCCAGCGRPNPVLVIANEHCVGSGLTHDRRVCIIFVYCDVTLTVNVISVLCSFIVWLSLCKNKPHVNDTESTRTNLHTCKFQAPSTTSPHAKHQQICFTASA